MGGKQLTPSVAGSAVYLALLFPRVISEWFKILGCHGPQNISKYQTVKEVHVGMGHEGQAEAAKQDTVQAVHVWMGQYRQVEAAKQAVKVFRHQADKSFHEI